MTTVPLPSPRPGPGPADSSDLLALYGLAVEMADRVSARRGSANAFFLSVQTALVTVLGLGIPRLEDSAWWVVAAVTVAGMTLSAAWWLQLRTYRDLNAAKFRVINALEQRLPAQIFTEEWDHLKAAPSPNGRRGRYAELGLSERLVPLVFAGVYPLLLVGTLLR
ncbi:RipA family octameric membrane protein [Kitasatospora sp. NPDC001664]